MTNWVRAAVIGVVGLLSMAAGQAPDGTGAMSAGLSMEAGAADARIEAGAIDAHDDVFSDTMPGARPDAVASLAKLVADVRAEAPVALTAEARCLATAIYFESKGEPLAGQLAVAQVILNRAESGRWARDACGVMLQPRQFSFIRGGRAPEPRDSEAWAVAQAVALIALSDSWRAVVGDATHFHATRVNPGWAGKQRVATIGRHVFYR